MHYTAMPATASSGGGGGGGGGGGESTPQSSLSEHSRLASGEAQDQGACVFVCMPILWYAS